MAGVCGGVWVSDPFSTGEAIALFISAVALIISGLTFYFGFIHSGDIKATRPTQLYLGSDGGPDAVPKVFATFSLFATSVRGVVVENLFARVTKDEKVHNFPIWVLGPSGNLQRGSGIFVGKLGVSVAHHFMLPAHDQQYSFGSGTYDIEIFAQITGRKTQHLVTSATVDISIEQARQMLQGPGGVYFDWGPDARRYHSHYSSLALMPPVSQDPM
jgi:hypothetical protein